MQEPTEVNLPFRWDLITPDQLGSMLTGVAEPDLWFVDDLAECAGKVLARSGNGDLIFVGRSLDSMFDLLSGALSGTTLSQRMVRLPFSFQRKPVKVGPMRWRIPPLTSAERAQAHQVLADLGLSPQALARRTRPVTFVDVVHEGSTFTELFELVYGGISEAREPWNVVRTKARFVGVTSRGKTSPNTFRWQQHAEWTRTLPARSVVNVSLDGSVWSYLGNTQTKLTRSFRPERWLAGAVKPARDDNTRSALAEAVALVSYGRSAKGRRVVTGAIDREPALAEPWLRALVRQLKGKT